jgi:hypothetical protein
LRAEEKFALAEEFNRITADLENVRSAHVATEDSITAVRRLFSARKTPAVRDILAGHVRKIVKDVNVFFPIALRAREAAVIAQATASRKLLRLAKMRSGEECLDDYKFRFSDKHRRKALALAEKLKPRSCWVEVHFKSGIVISTKGQPSGLRLKEEPAFTMEEIDSEGIMIGKIDLDAYGNTPRLTKGTIEEFLQAQQSVAGS